MKKLIAFSAVLFLAFGTAFAGPPTSPRPGANTPASNPRPVASTTVTNPRPSQPVKDKVKKDKKTKPVAAPRGLKKGWTKNPHNPHHPKSDNPGHARK